MKAQLQFEFLVDKEKNTLTIRREFAAERKLVWDCYTKSELLNQWFAPKPFNMFKNRFYYLMPKLIFHPKLCSFGFSIGYNFFNVCYPCRSRRVRT